MITPSVKSEPAASSSHQSVKDQSKDFLFDPYAAAYYARFTDFNPFQQSLTSYLIGQAQQTHPASSGDQQLPPLKMTHYYQEYCHTYEYHQQQ